MSDNLKAQGIKALTWDFFGKIARHGTTFIVTIVLARLLEPSDFALSTLIDNIISMKYVNTDSLSEQSSLKFVSDSTDCIINLKKNHCSI